MSFAQARTAHGIFRAQGSANRSLTFEEVARKWLKLKLPTLSNLAIGKHQLEVAETLEKFANPMMGSMPVDTIKRADLVRVNCRTGGDMHSIPTQSQRIHGE